VISSSELGDYIDRAVTPLWLKGDLDVDERSDEWLAFLKEFYETKFQPALSELVKDNPVVLPTTDYWDPEIKLDKKERKEEKKLEKSEKKLEKSEKKREKAKKKLEKSEKKHETKKK
jgi:hypothetical protein